MRIFKNNHQNVKKTPKNKNPGNETDMLFGTGADNDSDSISGSPK